MTWPERRALARLVYDHAPAEAVPVGSVKLDESIVPLVERAGELLGFSDALQALEEAYQPGRTLAEAFAAFYAKIFAAQGLLLIDAAGREFHRALDCRQRTKCRDRTSPPESARKDKYIYKIARA